tara:strand:- start:163 stop:396 length:234 start_codon:yes stop_codon:yes gene_type:complete
MDRRRVIPILSLFLGNESEGRRKTAAELRPTASAVARVVRTAKDLVGAGVILGTLDKAIGGVLGYDLFLRGHDYASV